MSTGPSRSRSVVALLADIPTTGHLGAAQARRFALAGDDHESRSGAFVDFALQHVRGGYKVVALYPKWHAERAERAIRFARGALLSDGVAAVPVDLSPLALSLLADQLAYLSPYLPAGIVTSLAGELPQHMLAGAWLRNVNNLGNISISLKQHIGSYTPKALFLAFCSPTPRVGRVKKLDPTPNIPYRPVDPAQMLYAPGDGFDPSTFEEAFVPAMRAVSTHKLAAQPLGKEYWGSSRYVEFVAFSAHPEALTQPARGLRPITCAWCRDLVTGGACAFCGAANQIPAGRPPGYSKTSDVPPPINTQPQDRRTGPAQAAIARYQQQQHAAQAAPSGTGPQGAPQQAPPGPAHQQAPAPQQAPARPAPQPQPAPRPHPSPGTPAPAPQGPATGPQQGPPPGAQAPAAPAAPPEH
ncbi:hypothetical protein [Nocardiopsis suaedae]|uniref:Uncharacterized protein n=1 Tax=Nocardiopsis suaedae TaxID=3018444 RepID=A0ABT4TRE7_9ACTN|nr:hypothetical protein [Nocardiopsis suaedae]MDA2807263.1 hypothetical protein [Nocardiopsis suaedae]